MRKADNLPLSCAVVTKSGNLNFLEPCGPVTGLLYLLRRSDDATSNAVDGVLRRLSSFALAGKIQNVGSFSCGQDSRTCNYVLIRTSGTVWCLLF